MSFIVLDTETTGMGPEDQVIEIGGVFPTPEAAGQFCFLVKPTVPISVEARAAHHITDKMLDNVANAETWRPTLEKHLSNRVPVFHNAEFDIRLIKQTWPGLIIAPHICTYRVALHLWPDAPRHGNQVLRYWLGVEPKIKTNLPPHRALPDAAITYAILERAITQHNGAEQMEGENLKEALRQLIQMTTEPVVLHRVRFGKHVDQLWSEVPSGYLQWILRDGDFDRDVVHTARHYLG